MDTPITQTWGVLLSEHQRHKLVKNSLTDFGFQFFLPMIEDTAIVNGRHVHRMRPLLGRYVFFIINEFWRNISQLRGVAGLMLNIDRDYPAVVDDSALDAIRAQCIDDVYQSPVVNGCPRFFYGQRVIVESGPLMNYVGRYDGRGSKNTDIVTLFLFGRECKLPFKTGTLRAAADNGDSLLIVKKKRNSGRWKSNLSAA